ncbi:MAG: DUF3471 domain-containing protein, partial [Pseudomonadales bacterium]|jgi:hypothetical protein|nr:DUF3471 domain-containing protein [Pseudomonadales bacterium]
VLDPTPVAERRDWHGDVLALYRAREAEAEAEWDRIRAARRPDAPPTLPLDAYAGRYRSPAWGAVELRRAGAALELRTGARRYGLAPWHGDVFLLTHHDWNRGDFVHFTITPDARVGALRIFDSAFERVEE